MCFVGPEHGAATDSSRKKKKRSPCKWQQAMSEIRGGASREKHFADNAEIAGSPITTGTNRMDQARPGVVGMAGDDITSPSAGSVCTYVCWLGVAGYHLLRRALFLARWSLSFVDPVLLAMIKTTISFEFILKVGTRRASGTQKNKKHAREETKEPFEKILFSG